MEIVLKVTDILTPRSFTKRDGTTNTCYAFIGEYSNGQYTNKIKFDVWNAQNWQKWLSEGFGKGSMCKVMFDIKSSLVNDKWYTNVTCWGVNVTAPSTAQEVSRTENNAPY